MQTARLPIDTGMGGESTPASDLPIAIEPEPAEIVATDDPDPATARVAGVPLGEPHETIHDWLATQLAPAADEIDLHTHGGSLRRAGLLPDANHEEVRDGLATMADAAGATPRETLSEFAARRFTYGRAVAERTRRLDQLAESLERAASRLVGSDAARDRAAVLVTLGDRLAATGASLFDRYADATPGDPPTDDLPRDPDPRDARELARTVAAYDRTFPSPPEGGTLTAVPTGTTAELTAARESLAYAAVTVAYARWDGGGWWPLEFPYRIAFARESPAARMDRLPAYEPHGLWVDARAFDGALADRVTRLRDGRYLARFRRVARLYVVECLRLAGRSPPEASDVATLVGRVADSLPRRLGD